MEKKSIASVTEPDAKLFPDGMDITGHSLVSIAISLKRIADAMEKHVALPERPQQHPTFGISTSVRKAVSGAI